MQVGKTNTNLLYFHLNKQNKSNSAALFPFNESDFLIRASKDASNDNQFTKKEALKNFVSGMLSPLKGIKEHPFISLGMIAASAVLCSLIPVMTPVMTLTFGAASLFTFGKGCYCAAKEYSKKEYDKSEKSFREIGIGFSGILASIPGIKQSAKIANEAKVMNKMCSTRLTYAQRQATAQTAAKKNLQESLKEIFSLFTKKEGREAFFVQFKPFMIKARAKDLFLTLTGKNIKTAKSTNYKRYIKEFRKTAEGKRRAALTDKQIENQAAAILKDIFDELNVPEKSRPKLVLQRNKIINGGSYINANHTINYNPEAYRSGIFEMEQVLRHESTHVYEALLRSGLPNAKIPEIAKRVLTDRIINGEYERIIKSGNMFSFETMEAPIMPPKLRHEFAQFANEYLYNSDIYCLSDLKEFQFQNNLALSKSGFSSPEKLAASSKKVQTIINQLKILLDNNPDFTNRYESYDAAFQSLTNYTLSHKQRYHILTKTRPSAIKPLPLDKEQAMQAEQSLYNYLTSVEGNARIREYLGTPIEQKAFTQYSLSHEEVLAEQKGWGYFINKLRERLKEGKAAGNMTAEEESRILNLIQKGENSIELKTKGLNYYEKYTQLLNNPEDTALRAQTEALRSEVKDIQKRIPLLPKRGNVKTQIYRDAATVKYPLNTAINISACTSNPRSDKVINSQP